MRTAKRTLLLNVGYEPVRVVSWQRAVTMIWLDKVDVVSEYDQVLRSSTIEIQMPAVMRLRRYHPHIESVKFKRHFVYARDRWNCQFCQKRFPASQLTYDHVLPKSRGGRTTWENIVTSCSPCNHEKGDRTPEEAGMKLLKKPVKPRWFPEVIVRALEANEVPDQWYDWISWLQE